jgi:hypothetical protein
MPHAVILQIGGLEEIGTPLHGNAVLPVSAQCAASRGINAGKRMEVTREVRLVRISANSCQLRPSNFGALVQSAHCALKASHPAPLLGRKTNILTEDLVQAPLADTKRDRRFANAVTTKQAESSHNVACPFPRRSLFTKHVVQHLQRNRRTGCWLAQALPRDRPQVVKRKRLFKEEVRTFAQPGAKSSRPKDYSDQPLHIAGRYQLCGRARANQQCRCDRHITLRTAIGQVVRRERNDKVDLAPRQHQLPLVRHMRSTRIPELFNAPSQRWQRLAL